MAEGQKNIKSRIMGLLEIKQQRRGLEGQAAVQAWAVNAIECLLEAELARIEKREVDQS